MTTSYLNWLPNCHVDGIDEATIKCLDVYFFQYSANNQATSLDTINYNDTEINGMTDVSAVIYATTLLGTQKYNGLTRKYFVFRETGWDFTVDPVKIIFYDSLDSSMGAISAAYCPACSDYQFTQFFCMAKYVDSVRATGIPTASTYPSAAGTADNRLAMAPYYLLYFSTFNTAWAKNGTVPYLGPGEARISLNPNSCQIPASWVCTNPEGYRGGPFPASLWSRATSDCIPCQQNVQTTFLSLLCDGWFPDLRIFTVAGTNYDYLVGYTITDDQGRIVTITAVNDFGLSTGLSLGDAENDSFTIGVSYLTNYPLTTTTTDNCVSTEALNMRRKAEVLQHKKK